MHNIDEIEELVKLISKLPGLGSKSAKRIILKLINSIKKDFTSLEAIINNAAIHGPIGPLWKNDWNLWQEVIQVNLLAPVALCHGLFPLMTKTKGSIINLSGGGATAPSFLASPLCSPRWTTITPAASSWFGRGTTAGDDDDARSETMFLSVSLGL